MLHLQINVTASFKQLFCDSLIAICCRNYERCRSILPVKINVAASYNELLRDGRMIQRSRDVERRVSKIALVVNPGLRACRRKHLPNSHCIAMTQRQKECGCWLGFHGCLRFHQEPLHAAGEHGLAAAAVLARDDFYHLYYGKLNRCVFNESPRH